MLSGQIALQQHLCEHRSRHLACCSAHACASTDEEGGCYDGKEAGEQAPHDAADGRRRRAAPAAAIATTAPRGGHLRLPFSVDVRGRSADVHNIEARQTRLLLHPCMLWRHSAAAVCCTGLMVRHHNAACWVQAAATASPSFLSQSNTGRSCHHLLRHLAGGVAVDVGLPAVVYGPTA